MTRKTKKMIAVEEKFHQPLEKILPEMVTDQGLSSTADQLGVSKATLGYWLLAGHQRQESRPGAR